MPATVPADIVNRALDECGIEEIGDLTEGSKAAKVAIRIYEETLLQLLSAAHWNFARQHGFLQILGDRSATLIANTNVPGPWNYMYEWPVNAVHARFVPRTNDIATVDGTVSTIGSLSWSSPAPFIVGSTPIPNDVNGQWYLTQGHDPEQTRVILTNQARASLVFTGYMMYPDAWDPLFRQAMVAVLAARLAMPLIEDKKLARVVRGDNISIAKQSLDAARIRDGDEGWTVQNHTPDWMRARTSGESWWGPGVLCYPWMNMSFVEDAGGVY